MRLQLRQKASSGGGWFLHSQCVLDGLTETDTVLGADGVSEAERQQLTELKVVTPTAGTDPAPPQLRQSRWMMPPTMPQRLRRSSVSRPERKTL